MHVYIALPKAQKDYEEKVCKLCIHVILLLFMKVKSDSNVPQKSLFKLAWKVKELETPADNIRQLVVDIKILVERVNDHNYSLVANNVAGYLCSLCG